MAFKSNIIYECIYCGERDIGAVKYCKICKTKVGRKQIFDANVKILKENLAKGFKVPTQVKSWK